MTNDLQKATSDISSISPGPSPLSKPTTPKQIAQKQALNKAKLHKSPAARQLFSNPSSSKAPLPKGRNVPAVSNSFLKGISLFKSSNLPSVTPYTAPPSVAGKSSVQPVSPRSVTAQILAQQRMTSDSAAVVRVTKNITNDPVIIDVEAPASSKSMMASSSGLQLTQPRSAPLQTAPHVPPPKVPQQSLQVISHPKPVLTVGTTNASALKSLVSKISKKPVLSIPKKPMSGSSSQLKTKSSLEVVVIDGPSPVKTTSVSTSSLVTSTPQRRTLAPELTSPHGPTTSQASLPVSSAIPSSSSSSTVTVSPVLSALGLQPSNQANKNAQSPGSATSASSPVPPLSHLPVSTSSAEETQSLSTPPAVMSPPPNGSNTPQSASSDSNPTAQTQSNGMKSPIPSEGSASPSLKTSVSESSRSSTAEETKEVKIEESGPTQPQISCVQCDPPDDEKYSIPSEDAEKPPPAEGEISNASSDLDFPSEIFAEETPAGSNDNSETSPTKEPFKSPTSLSDALHAASDALLEHN